MHKLMLDKLQSMRDEFGQPIIIHSGYRCAQHPVEKRKERPGEHSYGLAVDIKCYGSSALELIRIAQEHEIERMGVMQKGDFAARFIHIGLGNKLLHQFKATIWTY